MDGALHRNLPWLRHVVLRYLPSKNMEKLSSTSGATIRISKLPSTGLGFSTHHVGMPCGQTGVTRAKPVLAVTRDVAYVASKIDRMHISEQLTRRDFLKQVTQTTAAIAGSAASRPALAQLLARAVESDSPRGSRISYFFNGEIHVSEPGKPEGKPLTTAHMDFKPSWSKTGNNLVFFRRTRDDPEVNNWKGAISIINVDGTGFHQLSDGTFTDFNPTWTRDGLNTPI